MNKKEAIERIQELVATEEINECLEILRQPMTLADFLGWEEDVEYELNGYVYKIKENYIYEKWIDSTDEYLTMYTDIVNLQQAQKKNEKGVIL